jgi:hypothetical protein
MGVKYIKSFIMILYCRKEHKAKNKGVERHRSMGNIGLQLSRRTMFWKRETQVLFTEVFRCRLAKKATNGTQSQSGHVVVVVVVVVVENFHPSW